MRELTIGGKTVRVRATPLALLYYKQEFNDDLLGSIAKMQELENDASKLDGLSLLQMIWAMAKADAGFNAPFPPFEKWLSDLESFDLSDPNLLKAALEEAVDGFFRRAGERARAKREKKQRKHKR